MTQQDDVQKTADKAAEGRSHEQPTHLLSQEPNAAFETVAFLLNRAMREIVEDALDPAEALSESLSALSALNSHSGADTVALVSTAVSDGLEKLVLSHRLQNADTTAALLEPYAPKLARELRVLKARHGLRLVRAGNLDQAQILGTDLLAKAPEWPAAQRLFQEVVQALIDTGAPDRAEALLETVPFEWPQKAELALQIACQNMLQEKVGWRSAVRDAFTRQQATGQDLSWQDDLIGYVSHLLEAERPEDSQWLENHILSRWPEAASGTRGARLDFARTSLSEGKAAIAFAAVTDLLSALAAPDCADIRMDLQPDILALAQGFANLGALRATQTALDLYDAPAAEKAAIELAASTSALLVGDPDGFSDLDRRLGALLAQGDIPAATEPDGTPENALPDTALEDLLTNMTQVETRLLEEGRYDTAIALAATICQHVPEHGYAFRSVAIRHVTASTKQDQSDMPVPLMAHLLENWPFWSAAQRVSVRLARNFLKAGDPDAGLALLNATPHIWLEKELFDVSHALWQAETDQPGWRNAILRILKATARPEAGPARVSDTAGPVENVTALPEPNPAEAVIRPEDRIAGTSRLVVSSLSRMLENGLCDRAHWVARKFGRIDAGVEKAYRSKAGQHLTALVGEGALAEATLLGELLLRDYPDSVRYILPKVAALIQALIDVDDLATAEKLLGQHERKWIEGDRLRIALTARKVLRGDANWKWLIHRIWHDLGSSEYHKPGWIRTQVTKAFLDICDQLCAGGDIDQADQIAVAINRRSPGFNQNYAALLARHADAAFEAGNKALSLRILQSLVQTAEKPELRKAALSIATKLYKAGRGHAILRLLSGISVSWTEAQRLRLQIILARMVQDRTAGRQAFISFLIEKAGRSPLPQGDLAAIVATEITTCFEGLLQTGALEEAWALQAWFVPAVPGLARKLRVKSVEIANVQFKAGQVKKAAGIMHLVCSLHPDWDAGQRVAYRISQRLIQSREIAMAAELMSPLDDIWVSKHLVQLEQMIDGMHWLQQDWSAALSRWWQKFRTSGGLDAARDYLPVRNRMIMIAQGMIEDGDHEAAETTLLELRRNVTGDSEAHMLLARLSELKGDYQRATERWQMAAALAKPSNNQQGRYMLQHGKNSGPLLARANLGLRSARCHLALQLVEQGASRQFIEVVSRITESLGSTSIYQEDRLVLDVLSRYVRFCLSDTHPMPATLDIADQPRRIIMCLDVLKLSDFHLHSRVVFTMSRSLLDRMPDLEIFVVITNERFAVTRPNIGSWIDFDGNDYTYSYAEKTVGDHFGQRFHLIFQRSYGLEGVVNSCKEILDLKPDLIAYAGGHGRYSNDSRIIRHALFPYMPSALFFLGVDNSIDDQVDMILPRGPHELVGDPGAATIRVQTYPTLPDGDERIKTPKEKPLPRYVVSALAGARFDTRMRDLPENDLRTLLQVLDRNPDVVWNFVGADNPAQLVADVPLLQKYVEEERLSVLPVMEINAFREFVTDATLFVQLPGFKGGAGGAGMARRSGVPVLTFANSDASGRQPPETVFEEEDVAGIAGMAARLLADPAEAAAVTQSQFAYAEHIRETSAYGFYDCLVETVRLARERIRHSDV